MFDFWKALGLALLTLTNFEKIANLQESKYLLQNLVFEQKMCKTKIAQNAKNYTLIKSA